MVGRRTMIMNYAGRGSVLIACTLDACSGMQPRRQGWKMAVKKNLGF